MASANKTSAKTPARKTKDETAAAKPAAAAPVTFHDLEKFFDDFMQKARAHPLRFDWPRFPELPPLLAQTPAVDVVDRDKEVVVRAQLPGFKKSDLDVSVADRMLTIKGERREEQKEEKDNYFHQEIRTGSFSRSVLLPADVDAAKAEATFKDGVLELTLPKRRIAKQQQVAVR